MKPRGLPAAAIAALTALALFLRPDEAGATAPERSLHPVPRGDGIRFPADETEPPPAASPVPRARPRRGASLSSARGLARGATGAICNNPDIRGEVVGRVPGLLKGCGVESAVRVHSVSGVALSQPAVMDCTTARALDFWVKKGARPALRREGRLSELKVAAGYACRTRNGRPGARISEHGKGRAIDISAFVMRDGSIVTVKKGWREKHARKSLLRAWRAACGPFGTVLGPDADRYHRDHFHLDTARYRGGPWCR